MCLAAYAPYIVLDDKGVCNICLEHDRRAGAARQMPLLETDFIKMLKQHKGKGAYDCLVMCSGGKDSTAALYYMKKDTTVQCLPLPLTMGLKPNLRCQMCAMPLRYSELTIFISGLTT